MKEFLVHKNSQYKLLTITWKNLYTFNKCITKTQKQYICALKSLMCFFLFVTVVWARRWRKKKRISWWSLQLHAEKRWDLYLCLSEHEKVYIHAHCTKFPAPNMFKLVSNSETWPLLIVSHLWCALKSFLLFYLFITVVTKIPPNYII